ncbi:hypothetical protein MK139_10550 [bacterium]|jgi:hypothetical protein|nr:hypothetical protein [bacterium]
MTRPRLYIPAACGLLLLCVLGFAHSNPDTLTGDATPRLLPERGLVTFAEGSAQVRRSGGNWEPLYVGDRVGPTDSLRSLKTGRSEISWGNPKCVLRVESESVVALDGAVAGNRLVLVGARVNQGAVWAKVIGEHAFRLSTEHIRASFDQATLSMRSDRKKTRLAVYQGQANVGAGVLYGGQGMWVAESGTETFAVGPEDDLRDGWHDIVKEALVVSEPAARSEAPQEARTLTRDVRDLSPEIYLGVEVELTRLEEKTGFVAEAARIRKIRVRSSRWDDMQPDRKVQLLKDTFYVLKERYPQVLETVVLEFDDNRPRLVLKYAATG